MADQLRGFAKWITDGRGEEVREIARRGGEAAHAQNKAHRFTSEEAREAGRKGGAVTAARKRAVKESGHG